MAVDHGLSVAHEARIDNGANRAAVAGVNVGEAPHEVGQEPPQVDRLQLLPRQFGIEARGVGHVIDQPVQAFEFPLDLNDQLVALLGRARVGQRLGR